MSAAIMSEALKTKIYRLANVAISECKNSPAFKYSSGAGLGADSRLSCGQTVELDDTARMSAESTMLALGTLLPDFALPDVATGRVVKSGDFVECRALVVVFLSTQCPYVARICPELVRITADYASRGVGFIGISSNDITRFPQDAPGHIAAMGRAAGIKFPLLYDASQAVAKSFSAACTPDFFLFDGVKQLAYRGRLDASRTVLAAGRTGNDQPDGMDLRAALDAVLAGWQPNPNQRPSVGSSIQWRPGNAPAYFTN